MDTVPYGGQNWWTQLIQQLMQAMQGQRQQEQTSGYYYPSMYEPQPLNEEQAAQAIWSNRPDIQDEYLRQWGDPQDPTESGQRGWRPVDAIRNWFAGPGREAGEVEEGDTIKDWAIGAGYAVDYADAERERTLQRYIAENSVRLEEMSQEQRAHEFEERLGFDRERAEQAAYEFEERLGFDRYVAENNIRLQEMDHEQRVYEFEERLGFDREQAEQAAYEFEETHGLEEELGRGELALGYMQQMANVQGPRDWMQYGALQRAGEQTQLPEWQRRLAGDLGFPSFQAMTPMPQQAPRGTEAQRMSEEELARMRGEQAPYAGEAPMRAGGPGGPAYYEGSRPWEEAPMRGEQAPYTEEDLATELQQTLQGQQAPYTEEELGPMSGQPQVYEEQHGRGYVPGPQVYEGEGVNWQQDLATELQQTLQGQRERGPSPPAYEGEGQQQMAPWQQNLMGQFIQPHQIGSQQWQNMDPSEREMLAGLVETPQELGGWGMYWPDYQERMKRAWPTGQATGISYWR